MSLQRSGGVIGKLAEKGAPVSAARDSDGNQLCKPGALQSSRFAGVQMNCRRHGSIVFGVSN
jgi:hypothetical protein